MGKTSPRSTSRTVTAITGSGWARCSTAFHYTAASAALRWYDVVIPRDAIAALDRFDLESSLRQTAFVFAGRITTAAALIDGPRREASRLTGNPELLR